MGLALLHKPGVVTEDITSVILFAFKIRTEHNKSNNCIDLNYVFVCYQTLMEVRKKTFKSDCRIIYKRMNPPLLYIQGIFRTCSYRMLTHSISYISDRAIGNYLNFPDI